MNANDALPAVGAFVYPVSVELPGGRRYIPVTERVCAICDVTPGEIIHPSEIPRIFACLQAEAALMEIVGGR